MGHGRVVVFANQKGGVGKTTYCFQTARAAVLAGLTVLMIDLDPQGNLSKVAARDPVVPGSVGLADVLSARTRLSMDDVAVPAAWDGAWLAPTEGPALAWVASELVVAGAGREARLADALDRAEPRDLVVIDCPPSLDQLTVNGLCAADAAVVVTQAKLFSSDGLASVLGTIRSVQEHYNPQLRVAGVVANMVEARTSSCKRWLPELRDMCALDSIRVLDPAIPMRAVINDATEAGLGVDEWPSRQAGGLARIFAEHLAAIMEGER